jgi:hypothetical protein
MTMGDSANGTSGMVEQAKGAAGQVIDQASDKTSQLAAQAKEQARPALQTQKEHAAQTLSATAEALRKSTQHLHEQDQEAIARYMDQAAERVERFGGYLRRRDLDGLVADAEQFARRQPGLFLGGAFALGLLGARLLKSSSQRAEAAEREQFTGSSAPWPVAYGNVPASSVPTPTRSQDWETGQGSIGRTGQSAMSSGSSGPAWTSRDERASVGLSETSSGSSSGTEVHSGTGRVPGEGTS